MTSIVESANDMRAVSGSLYGALIVFFFFCLVLFLTGEGKGKKKKPPFRSHVLISSAVHTEAIKGKTVQYNPNKTCSIPKKQDKKASPQSLSEDEAHCLAMLESHLEH